MREKDSGKYNFFSQYHNEVRPGSALFGSYRVTLIPQATAMDLQLTGKTAVVLAASKGLGKACAAALASEGVNVVIGARDPNTLDAAVKDIRAIGKGQVLAIPIDVLQPKDADKIISAAVREFGGLDILINNAGGPPFGKFESFDESAWQSAFELTLLSAVRFSRLAIPHLQKSGGGRIINITSLTVLTYLPQSVLSTSLRMGVVGMAKMLSEELGPDHITVNNVAPGLILTDRVKDTLQPRPGVTEEELLAERAKSIPVGRIGRPEELAALVTFLASPLAAYITGATIPVDGGATRKPL
jgi:3-oxoacyl-[acyl-carrier protein] reductase